MRHCSYRGSDKFGELGISNLLIVCFVSCPDLKWPVNSVSRCAIPPTSRQQEASPRAPASVPRRVRACIPLVQSDVRAYYAAHAPLPLLPSPALMHVFYRLTHWEDATGTTYMEGKLSSSVIELALKQAIAPDGVVSGSEAPVMQQEHVISKNSPKVNQETHFFQTFCKAFHHLSALQPLNMHPLNVQGE
ncbi:unnamed protein product [Schistocephalus solidus]|uniref:FERM domain-containing protein n=1 Tax=Schistocephalus solidus TaxID=70667 RepID=A0A183TS00_SCHSO|nr:unnamed protein product [Schistocephalus solidus]